MLVLKKILGLWIGLSVIVRLAIAPTLSRALVNVRDVETLKQLAMLCGAGLLVSLLMLTWGLDLSPGFF